MSDYLSNLLAKNDNQLNELETIQPRLPSLFEFSRATSSVLEAEELIMQLEVKEVESPLQREIPSFHQCSQNYSREQTSEQIPLPSYPPLSTITAPTEHSSIKENILPQAPENNNIQSLPSSTPENNNLQSPPSSAVVPNTVVNNLMPIETAKYNSSEPLVIREIIKEQITNQQMISPKETVTVENITHNQTIEKPEESTANIVSVNQPNNTFIKNLVTFNTVNSSESTVFPRHQTSMIISGQVTSAIKSFEREPSQPIQPPTIQVTIGRIEVRATTPVTSSSNQSRPKPSAISLKEYLHQRGG